MTWRLGMWLIGGGLILGVIALIGLQRATIERKQEQIETLTEERDASRQLRREDQRAYAAAQRLAASMEKLRLEAAMEQQKEVNDATIERYEQRVAGLDDLLGGLRLDVKRAGAAGGARGGQPVPGVPDAARGPDDAAGVAYAPCDRDCLTALIRYDELISWVEGQVAIGATTSAAPTPTTG